MSIKNSFDKIFPKDLSKIKNKQKHIRYTIAQNINKFNGNDFEKFIDKILKHPFSKHLFNYVHFDYSEILTNPSYKINSRENELIWLNKIFYQNRNKLKIFIENQKIIDSLILQSKEQEALVIIESIEKEAGYSFWSIEYKNYIYKSLGNIDNIKILNNLKLMNSGKIFEFFIDQITYKSESKTNKIFIKNFLKQIKLLRDLCVNEDEHGTNIAEMFSSYFLPATYDYNSNINSRRISIIFNLPIIDQYILFKKYFLIFKIKDIKFSNSEIDILNKILTFINDEELFNILNPITNIDNIDREYLSILDKYTLSNYKEVKNNILSILSNDSKAIVFSELYARNNTYLKEDFGNNLFEKIALNFYNIMTLNNIYESIEFIEKIILQHNLSSWTYSLLFQLYNLITIHSYSKTVASKITIQLGNKITPLYLMDFSYDNYLKQRGIEFSQLPIYRQIKINITEPYNSEISDEDFEEYSKVLIKSDFIKDKVNYLINKNEFIMCASFIVDNILLINDLDLILPIEQVLEGISNSYLDEISIDIPILYNIFNNRNNSSKLEEGREFYEDYISQFNTHKPSEYFIKKNSLSKKEIYFLKNIAIPPIMDISGEYENSSELKKERLEILNIIENSEGETESISTERNTLFDELIFENIKASYNSSKLYVDLASIKRSREDIYTRFYNEIIKLKNFKEDILEEEEDTIEKDYITYMNEDKKVTKILMPSSDILKICSEIFIQLVNDFVKNGHFGLNKYLSTEIRHDVLFTHLRTCFEKYNLLTIAGANLEYESNIFWRKKYSLISNEIMNAIDDRLKKFSKDIDEYLKEVTSWFDIKEKKTDDGMFDFIPTTHTLSKLKTVVLSSDTYNNFIDNLFLFMWDITYISTSKIKKTLEDKFKVKIIEIIDILSDDINIYKLNKPLSELETSIKLVRGQIIEETDFIATWLNRVEQDDKLYYLISIINSCVSMFNSTLLNKETQVKCIDHGSFLNIQLNHLESRAIVSTMHMALINASKYGVRKKKELNIDVTIYFENNMINIKIENDMNPVKNKDEYLNNLNKKFFDNDKELSTSEIGGTGLHKMYNLLTNVSPNFVLNLNINKNRFQVIIGVKSEYFNN